MAIIRETKTQTYTSSVVVDEICDKCGKSLYITDDRFYKFNSTFEIEEGEVYPEGGTVTILTLQLCNSCSEKAVDILKENGFNFTECDKDY